MTLRHIRNGMHGDAASSCRRPDPKCDDGPSGDATCLELEQFLKCGLNLFCSLAKVVAFSVTAFHSFQALILKNEGVVSMRKVLLGMSAAVAAVSFSSVAEAKTYKKHIDERSSTCYVVEYIPSTYQYNTRGKLVSTPSTTWSGDIADGAVVKHTRNPAVYLTTRHRVEQDHYTMVKTGC
ncbi:hypothetical protein U0C82_13270 [Fulvimarina sp. 2208YS6-2-32]|uniref:Uncharacterized protein n=1 Tax=Fulvimarina uroteuthidis TaxID=3098149 RepID=A0ABU5I4G9_9HYPH|nr:hypothetical protein [Fulvimarina sp. 2208YS6-2-32]MDY8110111.1 hypothetical protein [Fulvimarina sp. 2208YS6-2-32]